MDIASPILPASGCSRALGRRGTTLLEIIIAMAVLTIGMLGYFTLHMRSLSLSAGAEIMSQATGVDVALQDQLLTIPYSKTVADDSSTAWLFADCGPVPTDPLADLCRDAGKVNVFGKTPTSSSETAFFRSWHVTRVTARTTTVPQVLVTVRVRYPSADGRCPTCLNYQQGWKAITTSVLRSQTAY